MKIFYYPVHTTLEYDEIILFTELGHSVFSVGLYGDSNRVEENFKNYADKCSRYSHKRPFTIPNYSTDLELLEEYSRYPENIFYYDQRPFKFSKDFLNKFDVFYVNHNHSLAQELKTLFPNKKVIFNTIGQSNGSMEAGLRTSKQCGVKVIRFFESEMTDPLYVEADQYIPQFVDDVEFSNWNGKESRVGTVCRGVPSRPIHTNAKLYMDLCRSLPMQLVGPGNESMPNSLGNIEYEDLKKFYRDSRVFFNLGTKPAGMVYTMVEALMTGCPVVSVGKVLGGSWDLGGGDTNAVPKIIQNGFNGFYSDNPLELVSNCMQLLSNDKLAHEISLQSREIAIKLFSKAVIKEKWFELLKEGD